jgi:hypothetical protein
MQIEVTFSSHFVNLLKVSNYGRFKNPGGDAVMR